MEVVADRRGFRKPPQDLRCHRDVLGQVEPQHDRQVFGCLAAPCGAPRGEHLGRGLGVHTDVPLGHRRGVSSVVECAAHDDQSPQQPGQVRFGPQGQCQVGQRPGRQADQFAWMLVCRVDPRLRGVMGGQPAVGGRQLRIAQAGGTMGVLGRAQRARHGRVGALRDGDVCGAAQLEQAEVVDAHLIHRDVAAGRRDPHQSRVGTGEQVDQGHRIVHTGVDVGEDGQSGVGCACRSGHSADSTPVSDGPRTFSQHRRLRRDKKTVQRAVTSAPRECDGPPV